MPITLNGAPNHELLREVPQQVHDLMDRSRVSYLRRRARLRGRHLNGDPSAADQAATPIIQICARRGLYRHTPVGIQNGGYRATAVTSNRHAARLVFQEVRKPSAEHLRLSRLPRTLDAVPEGSVLCPRGGPGRPLDRARAPATGGLVRGPARTRHAEARCGLGSCECGRGAGQIRYEEGPVPRRASSTRSAGGTRRCRG